MTKPPLLNNTKGGEWVIVVQKLSIYGPDSPPAQNPNAHVKAATLASGTTHTISVHLVAELTAFSWTLLLSWASSGKCFLKLEWSFPSHRFPKFTTRHILVLDGTSLSFAGSLDRYLQLFDHFHPSEDPFSHQTGNVSPLQCSSNYQQAHQRLSCASTLEEDLAPSATPVPWGLASHQDIMLPIWPADPVSMGNCLASGHATNSLDIFDDPGSPTSLTTGTTRQSSPDWVDTAPDTSQPSQGTSAWDRIQDFSRQREEAFAQYARNGDSSSIFAVLDAAAQVDEVWDSSGLAHFGPQRNL
ncbi:hypothetical protein B0T14DRAFT_268672 [Immersiella caudata]|uniref:Uncharacterized protein n=1 Tax=Immersiella caudata TaxID=314043 RepID=A0AA39WL33_9PEZI|nr:hypothetical protein B0T14DRAFT_268672 [Immersiella caudata]